MHGGIINIFIWTSTNDPHICSFFSMYSIKYRGKTKKAILIYRFEFGFRSKAVTLNICEYFCMIYAYLQLIWLIQHKNKQTNKENQKKSIHANKLLGIRAIKIILTNFSLRCYIGLFFKSAFFFPTSIYFRGKVDSCLHSILYLCCEC